MDVFAPLKTEDLLTLTYVQKGPCISLYMPLDHQNEESIAEEFDTLVKTTQVLLHKTPQKDKILDVLYNLNPLDLVSSGTPCKGLALFYSPHLQGFYCTQKSLPAKVVVAESFHLRPLLEHLDKNSIYNVLILDSDEALFFHCAKGQRQEQHHFVFQEGQSADRIYWRHQGETHSTTLPHVKSLRGRGKKVNTMFLRWVHSRIIKEPKVNERVLFIFTTDLLYLSFREIFKHSDMVFQRTEPIIVADEDSYFNKAEELMNLRAKKEQERQLFEDQQKNLVVDLQQITKEALRGHIATLYLRKDAEIWAHLYRKSAQFETHPHQQSPQDDDLLDDLACEVIKHGGKVIVLSGNEMPAPVPAAATLTPI